MKKKPCSKCDVDVDVGIKVCPHCNNPYPTVSTMGTLGGFVIIFGVAAAVIMSLYAAFSGNSENRTEDTLTENTALIPERTEKVLAKTGNGKILACRQKKHLLEIQKLAQTGNIEKFSEYLGSRCLPIESGIDTIINEFSGHGTMVKVNGEFWIPTKMLIWESDWKNFKPRELDTIEKWKSADGNHKLLYSSELLRRVKKNDDISLSSILFECIDNVYETYEKAYGSDASVAEISSLCMLSEGPLNDI